MITVFLKNGKSFIRTNQVLIQKYDPIWKYVKGSYDISDTAISYVYVPASYDITP